MENGSKGARVFLNMNLNSSSTNSYINIENNTNILWLHHVHDRLDDDVDLKK